MCSVSDNDEGCPVNSWTDFSQFKVHSTSAAAHQHHVVPKLSQGFEEKFCNFGCCKYLIKRTNRLLSVLSRTIDMNKPVKKVITFEEHYLCPETDAAYRRLVDQSRMSATQKAKLASSEQWVASSPITDIGERRLAWMDEYGVDTQVLSYETGVAYLRQIASGHNGFTAGKRCRIRRRRGAIESNKCYLCVFKNRRYRV